MRHKGKNPQQVIKLAKQPKLTRKRVGTGLFALVFAFLGIYFLTQSKAATTNPVDSQANADTVKLLRYLQSLPGRTSAKHISGEIIDRNHDNKTENAILSATGQYLGLRGIDMGSGLDSYERTFANTNWDAGTIIAVSHHATNPVTGGTYQDDNIDIGKMLTPGTNEWNKWHQQMDSTAAGLNVLQQDGVPIIWRPFHEFNCANFWWAYSESGNPTMTPDRFKAMWREMFTYFKDTKGLHNILWAWSPHECDLPSNTAWKGRNVAYPGDQYVDIIALDDYNGANHSTSQVDSIRNLANSHPTKVFGLSEIGGSEGWDMASSKGLMGLLQQVPQITFYMLWNNGHEHIKQTNWQTVINSPLIANRVDVKAGLAGTTTPPPPPPSLPDGTHNDTAFTYTGTWLTSTGMGRYQDNDHYASEPGATAKVIYTGSQVKVYAAKAPHHGIMGVSLNGGPETLIDLYSSTRQDQAVVYISPAGTASPNVLTLRPTGSKNTASTGTVITIDRADTGVLIIKQGDLNNDSKVNIFDLSKMLVKFNKPGTAAEGDLNANGQINIDDMSILLSNWEG